MLVTVINRFCVPVTNKEQMTGILYKSAAQKIKFSIKDFFSKPAFAKKFTMYSIKNNNPPNQFSKCLQACT